MCVAVAAVLSAVVAMLVFCAVAALRRTIPFGPQSRGVDDMGNQQVPFHAIFRALLHGEGPG